jgi:hypothetical protein
MPEEGLMQHFKTRFSPQVGHDVFVVHVSGNYQHGRSQASQGNGGGHGLLSVAAVMKIAAKDNEIGINILQIVKPLHMVMQIGKAQNSQRFHISHLIPPCSTILSGLPILDFQASGSYK